MKSATPEGTRSYFTQYPLPVSPVTLGKTGWSISPVGFGGYRIQAQDPMHRDALRKALTSGCNLIDTSTNYTNGSSETLIGEVLAELFANGTLKREQVVVVSKTGYVQGSNQDLARLRKSQGHPFAEMVEYHDDCWHCISPEFLEDQITRSLGRLKLETLDVLLLHNPEYFLKTQPDHAEYYRRIEKAFEHLEKEVERGRIRYFGISSNTFPDAKESPEYTSLETVLEIAQKVSDRPHFAVIQFPFNLFEPGATFEQNNSGKSVCELAKARGLGTLINRPLNAFVGNQLIRLADFPSHHGVDFVENLQQAMSEAMKLESRYPGKDVLPAQKIAWAHIIRHNMEQLADVDTWRNVLRYQIEPSLEASLELLSRNPATSEWAAEYRKLARPMLDSFTQFLEARNAMRSQMLAAEITQATPALRTSKTLSQKAIRIYRSGIGIDCVLVGMRRPEYVDDVLKLEPPLAPEQALDALEAAHEHLASEMQRHEEGDHPH